VSGFPRAYANRFGLTIFPGGQMRWGTTAHDLSLNLKDRLMMPAHLLGMLLSASAFFLFTCFDTLSKYLSQSYPIFQIMAVECSTAACLLAALALWKAKASPLATAFPVKRPRLHLFRAGLQICGQSLVFLALPHLSLAEFYIIVFSMPIIVVLKASWFLKERAAGHVWILLAVNFAGVLFALRPDEGASAWALVALLGTVFLAGSVVVLRKMMETETPEMASLTASAALALATLSATPFVYTPATLADFALMALAGAFVVPAQVLLATAFRLAPAALAIPPQFLQLVYGALAGYFVFGDVPQQSVFIGGAMVIASNAVMLILRNGRARVETVGG
jgi:drug/metabolite transporter (DMT)-like permease